LAYAIVADGLPDAGLGDRQIIDTILTALDLAHLGAKGAAPLQVAIRPLGGTIAVDSRSTSIPSLASTHVLPSTRDVNTEVPRLFAGGCEPARIAGGTVEGPHIRLWSHVR
jgi:hypothetical protein